MIAFFSALLDPGRNINDDQAHSFADSFILVTGSAICCTIQQTFGTFGSAESLTLPSTSHRYFRHIYSGSQRRMNTIQRN
jgi:hypothetical protein